MDKWEVLEERDISPGKWYPLYYNKVKLEDGSVYDYYISRLKDFSIVLPITENKEVILVKQYRHGIGKISIELPSGYIDGRKPREAAIKELEEETGIIAEDLKFLGKIWTNPTKSSQAGNAFLLKNAEISKKQDLDKMENIEVLKVPVKKFRKMIEEGKIKSSTTITAFALASINFPNLISRISHT